MRKKRFALKTLRCGIAFALFYIPSLLYAVDWPMFRADAARSGYTSEPLPHKLELLWVHQSSALPAPAWPSSSRVTFDFANQPVVVGDLVIFGSSSSDKVVAVDAASGMVIWSFFTGGPIRFAPAVWKDRVFVVSDDGFLYALRIGDGSLLWRHRGGPNSRMCLGNGRMISRWPARGGPVVRDGIVYYAAGIWPNDGIYLHALDALTGDLRWTNDSAGGMYMPQPHGGANAYSGIAPQGYLLASKERLFVPTGRAVPAAFERSSGKFQYYRLQQNGSIGGARALLCGPYVINAGCFLECDTGNLAARAGRGVFSVLPDGALRFTGERLCVYRWKDMPVKNVGGDKKESHVYRGLEECRQVVLQDESSQNRLAASVVEKIPALKTLYRTEIRFKEIDSRIASQTGLERTLSQSRPDINFMGGGIAPYLATSYERNYEVIAASREAVCGGSDIVRIINLDDGDIRWSYDISGDAIGLAAANGKLVVSTTKGTIYCFGDSENKKSTVVDSQVAPHDYAFDYAAIAKEIVSKSGIRRGVCVDLGCGGGELALELTKISDLHVIGINPDVAIVESARRMLDAAGVYGSRVTIHVGDPCKTSYARSIANLIVSSQALSKKGGGLKESEIERLQRPYGGVVCVGSSEKIMVSRRGALKGAGSWTHQNCGPANTICSRDTIVCAPLEMAWYRDGPLEIVDRHAQGPAPLLSAGSLVVEGVHGLCALDAYNGHTLWTYSIPDVLADWNGVHHDLGIGDVGSNFCLSHDSVFVRFSEKCIRLDLSSGSKVQEFRTPVDPKSKHRKWGYVAFADGLLFGSVLNGGHTTSPRYANIRLRNESVMLFAFNAKTGDLKWRYKAKNSIRNNAIAISGGKVYLIDRPIAAADRISKVEKNGKHLPLLKPGDHPSGTLLTIDAQTGKVIMRNNNDIFGTQLAVSSEHNILLMSYQAVKHSFFKLPSEIGGRMAAFDITTGLRIWDNKVDYKTRPIINNEMIYAEGGAWNLKSGVQVPWNFERSYGCGQIAGSTHMLLFRSATLGYVDLRCDSGTKNFGGIRPSCWFNAIPAGGRVLVPDGSSKCACSYQMRSWLALQPKAAKSPACAMHADREPK